MNDLAGLTLTAGYNPAKSFRFVLGIKTGRIFWMDNLDGFGPNVLTIIYFLAIFYITVENIQYKNKIDFCQNSLILIKIKGFAFLFYAHFFRKMSLNF